MGRRGFCRWDIDRMADANGCRGADACAAGAVLSDAVAHAVDGTACDAIRARLRALHANAGSAACVVGVCPQTVRRWVADPGYSLTSTGDGLYRAAALCIALAVLDEVPGCDPMHEARALAGEMPRDPEKRKSDGELRAEALEELERHCSRMPLEGLAVLAELAALLDR